MAQSSSKPPSAREALRRLSRKHPAPEAVETILTDLISAPDMSVAIVSAALVNSALEKLIASHFRVNDPNLSGRLFLNRGPLSDFNSKILVAQAFGIITAPLASELSSIQTIRNAFAHAKVQMSFDNELVGREIATLKMRAAILAQSTKRDREFNLDNKGWCALTCRVMIIILDQTMKHGGTADEALAAALAT